MGGGKGIVQEKSSDGPGPEKGRAGPGRAGPDWAKSFRSAGLSVSSAKQAFLKKKSGSGPAQTHHYNNKSLAEKLKARAGDLRKLLNWFLRQQEYTMARSRVWSILSHLIVSGGLFVLITLSS